MGGVSEAVILKIAKAVGSHKFDALGNALNRKPEDMRRYKLMNTTEGDNPQGTLAMLNTWREETPRALQVPTLRQALDYVGLCDLANELFGEGQGSGRKSATEGGVSSLQVDRAEPPEGDSLNLRSEPHCSVQDQSTGTSGRVATEEQVLGVTRRKRREKTQDGDKLREMHHEESTAFVKGDKYSTVIATVAVIALIFVLLLCTGYIKITP